jgi:hypothetical protein
MGQKQDGGKPKIVLRSKPVLPASAKPDPDKLYDIDRLSNLPRPELIQFVASEFRRHKATSRAEAESSEALKPLVSIAKIAGIMDAVFKETETRAEKSPPGIERSTARPPPRQPPDAPPVSIRAGSDPVSGVEDTVAVQSDQQPVPSRPPPAPRTLPPPPKFEFIDIDAEKLKINQDKRLRTRQTYEKLNELLLAAALKASELQSIEVESIKKYCGHDQKKLTALQASAKKLYEEGKPLPGPEARIVELTHTQGILKAIIDYPKANAEAAKIDDEGKSKKAMEDLESSLEEKVKKFTDYFNAKVGRGSVNRLEKYVDKICQFRREVIEKKRLADGEDDVRAMRASRNGPKAVEKDKTPRSAASAEDPEFVKHEQGRKVPSVPPERVGEPPASARTREPGGLRRFFTNPMTWTIIGISGFTSALVYKDSFREIAQALRILWHDKLHRPDFEFTRMHIYLGYTGVLLFTLATTELFRRRSVRKAAALYQQLNEGSTEERSRKARVVGKLTEIHLKYEKFEDQITHLRAAMLRARYDDEKNAAFNFMEDLYYQKKHVFFNEMLRQQKIPGRLIENVNVIFDRVKVEILQKKLNKLAELVTIPDQRGALFREYYDTDPIFKMLIDELFEGKPGAYANQDKQNAAFYEVLNDNNENVGDMLRKALSVDYESFRKS